MPYVEFWFTYRLRNEGRTLRIGKGHCTRKNAEAVNSYLNKRYPQRGWNKIVFGWHLSEAAALKEETQMLNSYERRKGGLPPWNRNRGGGGGQAYVKCQAYKASGAPCRNDTLAGNYGFCGVHRQ